MYQVALFLHVVGAVGIFAAMGMELLVMTGYARSRTAQGLRAHADLAPIANRVFPVASGLLVLTGLAMLGGRWHWAAAWAWVGLAGLVAMSALGPRLNGERIDAVGRAAREAADGPVSASLARQATDRRLYSSFAAMTGGVVGILFVMTVKPSLVFSIVGVVVGALVGLAIVSLPARARPASGPAMGA